MVREESLRMGEFTHKGEESGAPNKENKEIRRPKRAKKRYFLLVVFTIVLIGLGIGIVVGVVVGKSKRSAHGGEDASTNTSTSVTEHTSVPEPATLPDEIPMTNSRSLAYECYLNATKEFRNSSTKDFTLFVDNQTAVEMFHTAVGFIEKVAKNDNITNASLAGLYQVQDRKITARYVNSLASIEKGLGRYVPSMILEYTSAKIDKIGIASGKGEDEHNTERINDMTSNFANYFDEATVTKTGNLSYQITALMKDLLTDYAGDATQYNRTNTTVISWSMSRLAFCYNISEEYQKQFITNIAGADIIECEHGKNASKYVLYARHLSEAGEAKYNLCKDKDTLHYWQRALIAYSEAEDYDNAGRRDFNVNRVQKAIEELCVECPSDECDD